MGILRTKRLESMPDLHFVLALTFIPLLRADLHIDEEGAPSCLVKTTKCVVVVAFPPALGQQG